MAQFQSISTSWREEKRGGGGSPNDYETTRPPHRAAHQLPAVGQLKPNPKQECQTNRPTPPSSHTTGRCASHDGVVTRPNSALPLPFGWPLPVPLASGRPRTAAHIPTYAARRAPRGRHSALVVAAACIGGWLGAAGGGVGVRPSALVSDHAPLWTRTQTTAAATTAAGPTAAALGDSRGSPQTHGARRQRRSRTGV